VGLDPIDFLSETDGLKFALYVAIAQETVRIQENRDTALAVKIANEVGRMLGG
jgi:hypothetical protein